MNKKGKKHLTLKDRQEIEENLNQGISLTKIANSLDKHVSTISGEVKKYFTVVQKTTFNNNYNDCIKKQNCQLKDVCQKCCDKLCSKCNKCNKLCSEYIKEPKCSLLEKPPFVCNGCEQRKKCRKEKFVYKAKEAQNCYETTLVDSRKGYNLTIEEKEEFCIAFKKGLKQGHSPSVILSQNPNINLCIKTCYNYIEGGVIKGITNCDLYSQVKYKKRKTTEKPEDYKAKRNKNTINRTYEDFKKYIDENPNASIVEIDTVEGVKGGKSIFTLIFRKINFMMGFLIENQTSEEINSKIDILKNVFKEDFLKLFEVILTDNGKEFQLPDLIEKYDENNKVKLFYCDPGHSEQKPHIENIHTFLRRIVPKGTSFDNLKDDDVKLMINHINNYPRDKFEYLTPYSQGLLIFNEQKLITLGYHKIDYQDIILSPKLLSKK